MVIKEEDLDSNESVTIDGIENNQEEEKKD